MSEYHDISVQVYPVSNTVKMYVIYIDFFYIKAVATSFLIHFHTFLAFDIPNGRSSKGQGTIISIRGFKSKDRLEQFRNK